MLIQTKIKIVSSSIAKLYLPTNNQTYLKKVGIMSQLNLLYTCWGILQEGRREEEASGMNQRLSLSLLCELFHISEQWHCFIILDNIIRLLSGVKVEQEKRALLRKSFVPVKDSLLTTFGTGSHFDCVLRTITHIFDEHGTVSYSYDYLTTSSKMLHTGLLVYTTHTTCQEYYD